MAAIAPIKGSEHMFNIGTGAVLYIARVAVTGDADTLTLPTGTIISAIGAFNDTAITAAAVLSMAYATNIITFHDVAEASTVEVWAVCNQAA